MSTEESTSVSQSPVEEALDRAAESFPAFLMPRLVGVDHLQRSLSSARRRVDDSHKLQMKKLSETLGYEPTEGAPATEEDMAGISVHGDTHVTITSPESKQMPESAGKVKAWLPTAALILSMLGGGAGLGYVINELMNPNPAPATGVDTDTDTVVEMDFPEE